MPNEIRRAIDLCTAVQNYRRFVRSMADDHGVKTLGEGCLIYNGVPTTHNTMYQL